MFPEFWGPAADAILTSCRFQGRGPRTRPPPSVFLVRLGRSPSPFGIHGDRVLWAIDDAEEARLAVFTVYDFRRGLALAQHVEGAYIHAFAAIDTTSASMEKMGMENSGSC